MAFLRFFLASLLAAAGCAQNPQSPTAKVCVTDKHEVGSRVWITEWGKEGRITEVLGPSQECRNPGLPVLAVAQAA